MSDTGPRSPRCIPFKRNVCGVHGPPGPAHRATRRPRLRAGRLAAGRCPRLARESTPRSPTPKVLAPLTGPRAPQSLRAPGSSRTSVPRPPAPRLPAPRPPGLSTPGPSTPSLPQAQATPPAFPVAVSVRGRPTQPGQRGDSAERCTVRDRSSSSEPAGARRKLPLARLPAALAAYWTLSGAGTALVRERLAKVAVHQPAPARPHAGGSLPAEARAGGVRARGAPIVAVS